MAWFQRDFSFFSLAVIFVLIKGTDSSCEVPTFWQNKSWYMYRGIDDSAFRAPFRRQISIGVSELSGLTAIGYAVTTTNWTCYLWNETQKLIAFKGNALGDYIGESGYLYTAFQISESFNLPVFFPRTPRDSDVFDEFVKFISSSRTPTMEEIATKSGGDEFFFMMASDTTASQLQTVFTKSQTSPTSTPETTTSLETTTTSPSTTTISTPETTTSLKTTTTSPLTTAISTPETTGSLETTITTPIATTLTSLPVTCGSSQPSLTTQTRTDLPRCIVSDVFKAAVIFSVVGSALIGVFLVFIVLLVRSQKRRQ